jgi:hypothetical protein
MELYKKFREFVDLQEIVDAETWDIFHPILVEVERQDKKHLLFPAKKNTLSIRWLVSRPKESVCFSYYYLILMIQPAPKNDELNLVLASQWGIQPDEVFLEVFGQTPQSLKEKSHSLTIEDIKSYIADQGIRITEDIKGTDLKGSDDCFDSELEPVALERFSVDCIDPLVVAKKILTAARRIFKTQEISVAGKKSTEKAALSSCSH